MVFVNVELFSGKMVIRKQEVCGQATVGTLNYILRCAGYATRDIQYVCDESTHSLNSEDSEAKLYDVAPPSDAEQTWRIILRENSNNIQRVSSLGKRNVMRRWNRVFAPANQAAADDAARADEGPGYTDASGSDIACCGTDASGSDTDEEQETPGLSICTDYQPHWRDCPCGKYRPSEQARCECGNSVYYIREKSEPAPEGFERSKGTDQKGEGWV